MTRRDTVVIGASAGGVEALRALVAGLPADFPARVLVVLHVPAVGSNALAAILDRAGALPARAAEDSDHLHEGVIVVARPDHHLVAVGEGVRLTRGPRENGHRPSIDVLFRSAARAFGARVIGVILSGALDDGAVGLRTVVRMGGTGVVQDPEDAFMASMPRHAIAAADPRHVVPLSRIAGVLDGLVRVEAPRDNGIPDQLTGAEVAMAAMEPDAYSSPERPGEPSGFSCPDCHGVLFRLEEEGVARYRCRVGHAWSGASLVAEQRIAVEGALWIALRALEEKSALASDMARGAGTAGAPLTAVRFQEQADEAQSAADVLRTLIENGTAEVADA